MDRKIPLTAFFGAGASIHAGVPSTADITSAFKESALAKMAFEELEKDRFQSLNFEHILAVFEDLSALARSKRNKEDRFRQVISTFVQTCDTLSDGFRDAEALDECRRDLTARISHLIRSQLTKGVPEQATKDFLESMGQQFLLRVVTLNYDDLIDRTSDWFDGFSEKDGNLLRFQPKQFATEILAKEQVLLHLHGSVRYGYNNKSLVKFDSTEDAFNNLQKSMEAIDHGSIVTAPPIISGFNKVAKLNHTPVPYGYYYKALVDFLLASPLLLIIGYGGGDGYVNRWLHQFVERHGTRRRIGYITRGTENISELLSEFAGQGTLEIKTGNAFQKFGNLGLITGGFPVSKEALADLRKFYAD